MHRFSDVRWTGPLTWPRSSREWVRCLAWRVERGSFWDEGAGETLGALEGGWVAGKRLMMLLEREIRVRDWFAVRACEGRVRWR